VFKRTSLFLFCYLKLMADTEKKRRVLTPEMIEKLRLGKLKKKEERLRQLKEIEENVVDEEVVEEQQEQPEQKQDNSQQTAIEEPNDDKKAKQRARKNELKRIYAERRKQEQLEAFNLINIQKEQLEKLQRERDELAIKIAMKDDKERSRKDDKERKMRSQDEIYNKANVEILRQKLMEQTNRRILNDLFNY